MTKTFRTLFSLLAILAIVTCASAQSTYTTTTLSAALSASGRSTAVVLGSTTNVNVPNLPVSQGGIGQGSGNAAVTYLMIDRELMRVNSLGAGTIVNVERGFNGTVATAHNSGATVYVGPASWFRDVDPRGACVRANLPVAPFIVWSTGSLWDCPTTGPNTSVYSRVNTLDEFVLADGAFLVPPGACWDAESAHAGTLVHLGLVNGVPAIQSAITSSASSDSMTISCTITPPFRTTSGKGIALTDATWIYGVQTTNLPAPTGTLSSGTINSQLVFSKFVAPAAGASETASSATLVRADSGTLGVTPALASFNVTAVSAGQFYTQKFTPASPIVFSDLTPITFTIKLLVTDSAAIQLNSPGLLVHYINVPL